MSVHDRHRHNRGTAVIPSALDRWKARQAPVDNDRDGGDPGPSDEDVYDWAAFDAEAAETARAMGDHNRALQRAFMAAAGLPVVGEDTADDGAIACLEAS